MRNYYYVITALIICIALSRCLSYVNNPQVIQQKPDGEHMIISSDSLISTTISQPAARQSIPIVLPALSLSALPSPAPVQADRAVTTEILATSNNPAAITPTKSTRLYVPKPAFNHAYTAYIPAVLKPGQAYKNSCEFDAGWVILQTYGFDVTVDDLIRKLPIDYSVQPTLGGTINEVIIYGGDILSMYSGDYTSDYLARTTGKAFAQVFAAYGLQTQPVHSRRQIESALLKGSLVWLKTTVDFRPGRLAIWVTPHGEHIKTVLGNDHAVVVIGFNESIVVIRDVLGPTDSNHKRRFEYEIPWNLFMAAWEAQDFDALAVEHPKLYRLPSTH